MCATEALLSPQECENLGSIPAKIKEEILDFKRNNFPGTNSSSSKSKSRKLSNECEGQEDTSSDSNSNLNHSDLSGMISQLKEEDIFCRIFKMGFGKGKNNPVTDSTSFYRPNKNQEAEQDVTYAEGIVQPSKWKHVPLKVICFMSYYAPLPSRRFEYVHLSVSPIVHCSSSIHHINTVDSIIQITQPA